MIAEKLPDTDINIEEIKPEQNIFNLPIEIIENLMANQSLKNSKSSMQKILDLILTYFALSIKEEFPLKVELNQVIKPIGYSPKEIIIGLTNSTTGKIFPFTVGVKPIENNISLEEYLYDLGVDSLHTLKKISRCRHNEVNNLHFGVITDLFHWKFSLFIRPNKFLDVEDESNLELSTNYKVDYNPIKNKLDWVKLTEILTLFKKLMEMTDQEYLDKKAISEEKFKETANFKRRVKI